MISILKKSRCSYITSNAIIISNGCKIKALELGNLQSQNIYDVTKLFPVSGLLPLPVTRLLRKGIHHILELSDDYLMLVIGKQFLKINIRRNKSDVIHNIARGNRPLVVCMDNNNVIYWGEYLSNPKRDEVYIYTNVDYSEIFNVAYVFPKGSIRHVHGVFHDPYDDRLWVTTGDDNVECAIWVTDDKFKTLHKVIGGNQQVRTIQLLFSKNYVYFGSDSLLEKNFIYRMDKNGLNVERLQEVESSVFWGCKVGGRLFFSTGVEPSKVNKCRDACIWGSKDGENWKCVARFRKDIWPMKLFQYGQIFFPSGENNTEYLWYTPFATKKHQTVQRLKVTNLFDG